MIYQGDVDFWDGDKAFGFIRFGPADTRVFFRRPNVAPDWKGSRSWASQPGIPVKFELSSRRRTRGDIQKIAINVGPLFLLEEPQNLHELREVSLVKRIAHDFGFLQRPDGDDIFFHISDVVPGFESRWDFLKGGNAPVYHGIAFDPSTGRFRANCIELYSWEEIEAFRRQQLDPEPEPSPSPLIAATESELLKPEFRKKTLFEIMQLRRNK